MVDFKEIDSLIDDLKKYENVVLGSPADSETIDAIEETMKVKFPKSYRTFLSKYGNLMIQGIFIAGISRNTSERIVSGTVIFETDMVIDYFKLPSGMAVVRHYQDDSCICLDTNNIGEDGECPVLKYNLFEKDETPKLFFSNFNDFLADFLKINIKRFR